MSVQIGCYLNGGKKCDLKIKINKNVSSIIEVLYILTRLRMNIL